MRALVFLLPAMLPAQNVPDLQQVLQRLDRLEEQNRSLMAELQALRAQLAQPPPVAEEQPVPPLPERMQVAERRIDEMAQSKVETSQRLPVSLTGMALFNAFANGRRSGDAEFPLIASSAKGEVSDGGTFRQSVIGLKFDGPEIPGGGKVNGSLFLDLWGGSADSLNHLVRLRVASINIDWKNTSLTVGQDKPIIAPREPTSLAQVGVSPLTAAGNLWLWQPQVRLEQRFTLADQAGVRAQIGVYQSSDYTDTVPAQYAASLQRSRPALQGRFEFWKQFSGNRRIEIAPGFDFSNTHVAGTSVPSDAFSLDWLVRPWSRFEFTGQFFHGRNLAGIGGLRTGFIILGPQNVIAVRASGGWGQAAFFATQRLSFNIYGGLQDQNNADLQFRGIGSNQTIAANIMYRLGPNVLSSFEAWQIRTNYLGVGNRLVNHYDLALAYLF